jgi:hypothetical protein
MARAAESACWPWPIWRCRWQRCLWDGETSRKRIWGTLRTIHIRQHAQPLKNRKQAWRTDPRRNSLQDSSPNNDKWKEPMGRNCPRGRHATLHTIRSCHERLELLHKTFANTRYHGRVPPESRSHLITHVHEKLLSGSSNYAYWVKLWRETANDCDGQPRGRTWRNKLVIGQYRRKKN